MNKIINTLIGIGLLALAANVAATPIAGTINIGGASTVTDDGTSSTGIAFTSGGVNDGFIGPAPTGDFSGLGGINTSTGLTLNSFLYTDIPTHVLWSIDSGGQTYSFTLTSINVVGGDDINSGFNLLTLSGSGFFNITTTGSTNGTSYTQTPASWLYSQSGASFSSQTIPEPGTIALLGLGLVGIGAARRLSKRA